MGSNIMLKTFNYDAGPLTLYIDPDDYYIYVIAGNNPLSFRVYHNRSSIQTTHVINVPTHYFIVRASPVPLQYCKFLTVIPEEVDVVSFIETVNDPNGSLNIVFTLRLDTNAFNIVF
jgi:hypothetical protein